MSKSKSLKSPVTTRGSRKVESSEARAFASRSRNSVLSASKFALNYETINRVPFHVMTFSSLHLQMQAH